MNRKALTRIAEQFTLIPKAVGPMLMQAQAAGRLLADAMDKGAFTESSLLKDCRADTVDQGHGYDGFWIFSRQQWLPVRSKTVWKNLGTESPGWEYTFADDCRAVADLIDAEATEDPAIEKTSTPLPDPVAVAITMKANDPERSQNSIAKELKISSGTLSKSQMWQDAVVRIEAMHKREPRRGSYHDGRAETEAD